MREEAIRALPYDQLNASCKAKVAAVLENITLYRRLPTQAIRCDAELYVYMVEHPEVTVNIWEVLGITQMTLSRTGPTTFRANDGNGTQGDIEFLYTSPDLHLLYTVGTYEGPLFQKPVKGGCLLLLKSSFAHDDLGHSRVSSQLDLFFNVEHAGVDLFTKTFQPLVGKAADYNFIESNNFLSSLSRTGEVKPASMQQLAARLTNINPSQRQEFSLLMASVAQRASDRQFQIAAPIRRLEFSRPQTPSTPGLRR